MTCSEICWNFASAIVIVPKDISIKLITANHFQCLQYGWYLGADFQLFLIGTGIMTLIWRFPRLEKTCVAVMLMVAFVVPGAVIYLEKLDATMSFDMRSVFTTHKSCSSFIHLKIELLKSKMGQIPFNIIHLISDMLSTSFVNTRSFWYITPHSTPMLGHISLE